MNTIDVRQAIIDIFTDKTPHEIQRFSGLPLSRCIEIYTMFKVECMLPREVKAFLNKNTEGEIVWETRTKTPKTSNHYH